MAKQNQEHLGVSIQAALTQQEIASLLDALLATLSDELWKQALSQLPLDTQNTLEKIVTPAASVVDTPPVSSVISPAKLAQKWQKLWKEWDKIIDQASEAEGEYIVQEDRWEQPYFDNSSLVENLEKVAEKMRPLIEAAFEHDFSPNTGFVSVLLEAESAISASLPDWMEMMDGIHLEFHVTNCLLQWEWLTAKYEQQEPFQFVQRIQELEQEFEHISLDDDQIVAFLCELPDNEQQSILAELNIHQQGVTWKGLLSDVHSHWHMFYTHLLEKYEKPEIYLDYLRVTIPKRWENSLPIIEDFLKQQDYSSSLTVIQEALASLVENYGVDKSWEPENALLNLSNYHVFTKSYQSLKHLLDYYQQTSQGLGQTERANALSIQIIALDYYNDWSSMFKAFTEVEVSTVTRQALFNSWRNYLLRHSTRTHKWWLAWLLESIFDPQLGSAWFQQQLQQWFINLPGDEKLVGDDYDALHLLTTDVIEIYDKGKSSYPKFEQVLTKGYNIYTSPNDDSRRAYLQKYAPDNLWELTINYWRSHLHLFIPQPELVQNSDYRESARWMFALEELAPKMYQKILAEWRVKHVRRRNLWKVLPQT